ncbi:unnamed protein product [Prunus armeniaca]|uniref:Uncharacterized protein n=1 Tax=Prunus armeniaca TaxID=36596 RepID=A0A6J5UJJ7_PRUAR|nr:unnamed protein product [Prunus armeniaca]
MIRHRDIAIKIGYGVEESTKNGLIQAIIELQYGSVNQGSTWRKTDLLLHEIVKIRSAWRKFIRGRSVPSYQLALLQTNPFHEFWCTRVDTWFPESAKFFHAIVYNDYPFVQCMIDLEEYSLLGMLKRIWSI